VLGQSRAPRADGALALSSSGRSRRVRQPCRAISGPLPGRGLWLYRLLDCARLSGLPATDAWSVMRVEWLLICQSVTKRPDGTVDVRGLGSDKLRVLRLPAEVVCLGLLAFPPDQAIHTVEIELYGPDMVRAALQRHRFAPGPMHPEHPPGWEMHEFMPIKMALERPDAGVHTVTLRCEGASESANFIIDLDVDVDERPLNRRQRRHPHR
jgi:hypothetical protein